MTAASRPTLAQRLRTAEKNTAMVFASIHTALAHFRDEGVENDYVVTQALEAARDLAEDTLTDISSLAGEMPRVIGEWRDGTTDEDFADAARTWAADMQGVEKRLQALDTRRRAGKAGA
jgi:hypothetical protein